MPRWSNFANSLAELRKIIVIHKISDKYSKKLLCCFPDGETTQKTVKNECSENRRSECEVIACAHGEPEAGLRHVAVVDILLVEQVVRLGIEGIGWC